MTSPLLSHDSAGVERPGTRRPGVILAFLCVAQFMVIVDVSIVNIALPSIQRGLDMADQNLQYVVTAYGIVLGGFLLLGGRICRTRGNASRTAKAQVNDLGFRTFDGGGGRI